jgi:WhiB family transcriptional regulator, redox-sensing transcriptional regulator
MTATEHATEWRSAGACLSADPDLFFPISTTGTGDAQVRKAQRICARCEVQRECLEFALNTGETYGVWGGTTPEERRRVRRRKQIGRRYTMPELARVS